MEPTLRLIFRESVASAEELPLLTLFHMNKISSYSAWSGSLKTPRYKKEKAGIPLTTWNCICLSGVFKDPDHVE